MNRTIKAVRPTGGIRNSIEVKKPYEVPVTCQVVGMDGAAVRILFDVRQFRSGGDHTAPGDYTDSVAERDCSALAAAEDAFFSRRCTFRRP